jgi:hypothetical protein
MSLVGELDAALGQQIPNVMKGHYHISLLDDHAPVRC